MARVGILGGKSGEVHAVGVGLLRPRVELPRDEPPKGDDAAHHKVHESDEQEAQGAHDGRLERFTPVEDRVQERTA